MRSILLGILFLSVSSLGINAQVQIMVATDGGVYVDATSHNTWTTATNDLQAAIDGAAEATGGGTIWVEGGTYYPTTLQAADGSSVSGDRHATFVMAPNVTVMGGFEGDEITAEERPADHFGSTNRVTLSGDLNQNSDLSDNSYHVVLFPLGVDETAILESVYITEGNADGPDEYFSSRGGGVQMREGGVIRDCVITENESQQGGGGAYLYQGGVITESEISNNSTPAIGAGILLNQGGYVSNSLIHSNHAYDSNSGNGGGVYFDSTTGASGTLTHCVLAINMSNNKGGAIGTYGEANIINNLILNNEAIGNGGGVYLQGASYLMNNTIVSNRGDNGAGIYAANDGEIYNTVLWWNENVNINGSALLINTAETTTVNYCAIEGGLTGTNVTNITDLSSENSDPGSGTGSYPEFRDPVAFTAPPLSSAEVTTLLSSDYRINLNSALLNAGSSTFTGIPDYDLDGNNRIIKGEIDMGAYEAVYYTVTGTVTSGNGTIEPVGPVNYLGGDEVTITLTPDADYDVSAFTVNSTNNYDQIVDQGSYYTYTEAAISSDLSAEVTFDIANSVAETGIEAFNVYPIPTDDQLFIEGIEVSSLEIYSASGKLEKKLEGKIESPVNVSELSKGLYILIIEDKTGEVKTVRFIKN